MQNFAALLTCFNRKDKTISALTFLKKAYDCSDSNWKMTVYLTDDGSTDGTSEAVREVFPEIKILKGTGELYWSGGMRNSWSEALKNKYDAYLLLNDDSNVHDILFESINKTNDYCLATYEQVGVYIGATVDSNTKKLSYGGAVFKNRFMATMQKLPINNEAPQKCELGNANIMWVPKAVVDKIGILSEGYVHGMADFDYSLKALKKNIPILIMPGVAGECINDHSNPYLKFMKLDFKDRIKMLYNPIGLDFKSQVHHMKKHFPLRFPLFYLAGWFKVFFPKLYFNLFLKNRLNQTA
jgi:GT2 family glycosyltransferase